MTSVTKDSTILLLPQGHAAADSAHRSSRRAANSRRSEAAGHETKPNERGVDRPARPDSTRPAGGDRFRGDAGFRLRDYGMTMLMFCSSNGGWARNSASRPLDVPSTIVSLIRAAATTHHDDGAAIRLTSTR
jgi:hypothetical protein